MLVFICVALLLCDSRFDILFNSRDEKDRTTPYFLVDTDCFRVVCLHIHFRDGVAIRLKYVVDKKELSKKCKPCETLGAGKLIGERLIKILEENKDGVGLAANQVGIDSRVCVVMVDKPIVLINPRIVGKFGKSFFQEACLSLPGDYVITERWTDIIVEDDNHKKSLIFSFDKNALECVCVQHEIDHLDGITMLDRAVDPEIFNGKQ